MVRQWAAVMGTIGFLLLGAGFAAGFMGGRTAGHRGTDRSDVVPAPETPAVMPYLRKGGGKC